MERSTGISAEQDPVLGLDSAVAFSTFYESTYRSMVRLAVALVDETDVAEEVVQEAYARLFGRYEQVSNPGGYVRVAVVNRCRNVLRRRRVARRFNPPPAGIHLDVHDGLLDLLQSLSPPHREVIVLRYQACLSEQEISEVIGRSVGTVKSRLHRAREQLRKEIQP